MHSEVILLSIIKNTKENIRKLLPTYESIFEKRANSDNFKKNEAISSGIKKWQYFQISSLKCSSSFSWQQ